MDMEQSLDFLWIKQNILQATNFDCFSDLAAESHKVRDASVYLKAAEEILLENELKKHVFTYNAVNVKSDSIASGFREEANQILKTGDYFGSLVKYNASLCATPAGSENVGVAYANRSVVYMKMGYYKTALANIQLARDHNYPASKLEKLAEREQHCLEKIRAGPSEEDSFQKYKDAKKDLLMQKIPANEKYPCYVADCLTLNNSEEFGRHIRTKIDLKVGTIVLAEKHSATTFLPEVSYQHCEFCKSRNILNLIPCDSCIRVMYCSEKCRQDDFKDTHNLTCGIDFGINAYSYCALKLFCMGLNCFQSSTEFAEFLRETEDSDETAWDMDFTGLNQKEIDKKLLQSVNSYKVKKPVPKENFLNHFKDLAWFTATFLNFTKFQDILATDELKNMFRNFAFHQMLLTNNFYCQLNHNERKGLTRMGLGVLYFANFINHSCTPNIIAFYDDSKMHYFVLRPIKKGEQLFTACVSFIEFPVEARQNLFLTEFNFICECEACKNPKKYPLLQSLPVKNHQAFQKYNKMLASISTSDLKTAIKNYRPICKYLQEHDRDYPTMEIFASCNLIQEMIKVFCKVDSFS